MAENDFRSTVETLFKGMDSFITSKTVVGEAVQLGDTVIVPLVDVSFAVGAGAFAGDKKNNGGGGMGGKMQPSAVLVIQKGSTKIIDVKNQDGLGKILDMVPDVVNKLTSQAEDGSTFAENLANNIKNMTGKGGSADADPYDGEQEAAENLK